MAKPDPYFIEAAAKALDVLELFGECDEVRLTDVIAKLHLIKSSAFRLLYTLEKKEYIERIPGSRSYRKRRRHRIGFASMSASIPFVMEVEKSLAAEAARSGIELLVRRHEFLPGRALSDVEDLLASGISLLICYNPDEVMSHVIADRCAQAGVPIWAITFPAPGARIFGVNNYRAGLNGGEGLGDHLARRWAGEIDKVVLLDIPGNSPAQQARMTGMLEGLRKKVQIPEAAVVHLHTDRQRVTAQEAMRGVLAASKEARHIAVLCYNDANAIGAMHATEQAGRIKDVQILSQGGIEEVRAELRKARSALWGAVAHFPELFGPKLIPLVLRTLRGDTVPATNYTEHVLLTRTNVDRYYPSDRVHIASG